MKVVPMKFNPMKFKDSDPMKDPMKHSGTAHRDQRGADTAG